MFERVSKCPPLINKKEKYNTFLHTNMNIYRQFYKHILKISYGEKMNNAFI